MTRELIKNIETFTHEKNKVTNGYDIVSGLIKAHEIMFYRNSIFSEVTEYINLLERIQP